MDPGKLIETLVQKHFPKFGGIRKECLYQSTKDSDYSGGIVTPVVEYEQQLYAIFTTTSDTFDMQTTVMDNSPTFDREQFMIFPALDLMVTPKENDLVIKEDSSVWLVVAVIPDPQPGSYTLGLKEYRGPLP